MNDLKINFLEIILMTVFLVAATIAMCQNTVDTAFATVSKDAPYTNYCQVKMDFNSNGEQNFEVKMPVDTPGCYCMLNFAKNVTSFSASDENSNLLKFSKTDLNTWQIKSGDAKCVKISYDVYV